MGPIELAIILALVLLLFGSTIIPKVAKRAGISLGRLRYIDEDVREGRQDVDDR